MNSFRDVELALCLVNDPISIRMLDPEQKSGANAVLCCGYVDHTAGLTFEVLSLASCVGNDYTIMPEYEKMGIKLRADSVDLNAVKPIRNDALMQRYGWRIKVLAEYYKNREVVTCRAYKEFDEFRHPRFPDDILTVFVWSDQKGEKIWVRAEEPIKEENGLIVLKGRLLNEPNHRTHLHCGDQVIFGTFLASDERLCVGIVPKEV